MEKNTITLYTYTLAHICGAIVPSRASSSRPLETFRRSRGVPFVTRALKRHFAERRNGEREITSGDRIEEFCSNERRDFCASLTERFD